MSDLSADICIVGAGLSGAHAARALASLGHRIALLDARPRIGGRLLTAAEQGGGDLGGAWVWPASEAAMRALLQELDVPTVPMHLEGETVVRTQNGERHVIPAGAAGRYAACGNGAIRIAGGAASVVHKLLEADSDGKISLHLGTRVSRIEHGNDGAHIIGTKLLQSNDGNESIHITCRAAILAAPPKIVASSIEFDPLLYPVKQGRMLTTPTWMEDYGKVSVSFDRNWWRANNLSISIDQMGAVQTWWEACSGTDGDGDRPTLAGFVTSEGAEMLRKMESPEALFDHILDSLRNLYAVDEATIGMQDATDVATSGSADKDGLVISKGGITVTYKSWLEDPYTNVDTPRSSGFVCEYGDEDACSPDGSLFFAGTETASGLSGHMEGAVAAAQRVVYEVTAYLDQQSCSNQK